MKMKGVSPLIAAVLLIVFTVAIGAVVLNWMTSYTQGTTERAGTDTSSTIDCAKQILSIENVSKSNGQVTVRIENLGSASAELTNLYVYDDLGNSCEATISETLPAGGFKIFKAPTTPDPECDKVSNDTYTVRVSSSCGASDKFTYPKG